MSDIFNEVDEEVRREQLKKLWDRYGILIIALVVLFVGGVAAWRGYEWYEAKKAGETGAAFEAAATLSADGKHPEAAAAFAKIAADGTASYRALATLRDAAEMSRTDQKAAVAAYDTFAADGGRTPLLRDFAALRAGFILVDTASYDEVRKRLEPLTAADRTFRHSARGLLALAAWKANDLTAMRRWADMVLADLESPSGTRGQIEMLTTLTATEGKIPDGKIPDGKTPDGKS